jgi:hypothetical protein
MRTDPAAGRCGVRIRRATRDAVGANPTIETREESSLRNNRTADGTIPSTFFILTFLIKFKK